MFTCSKCNVKRIFDHCDYYDFDHYVCPKCGDDFTFPADGYDIPDDNDDGWTEEEIADMLDAGICPECGAELDICGHAKLFEFPDDGHTCYWIGIEVDDDDKPDGVQ